MPLSGADRIHAELALTFDDVRIEPAMSYVTMEQISLHTMFSSNIMLQSPFALSSAGVDGAIAAAQMGGIGIIPHDMPVSKQADFVRQVKRYQSRIVKNVMTVTPETSIIEALEYKQRYDIGLMPVVESGTQVFAGFLIFDDAADYDAEKTVSHYMSTSMALTVPEGTELSDAYHLMQQHEASFVAIIDVHGRCTGLITQEDKHKTERFPVATLDGNGALRVAAMVGTGDKEFDRVDALIDAGVDALIVNAAHGHSKAALDIITYIRRQRSGPVDVVAGNICTSQAALALIDAGANGLLVGDCEGYEALGIGVPSFTALLNACDAAAMHHVPVTFNGQGEMAQAVKAFAAGVSVLALDDLAQKDALEHHLCSAMHYTGCTTIKDFGSQTRFVRIGKSR